MDIVCMALCCFIVCIKLIKLHLIRQFGESMYLNAFLASGAFQQKEERERERKMSLNSNSTK